MPRRRVADTLSEIDSRLEAQGMPLLTEEDKVQIREKAKKHVAEKRRDKAESEYLARAIKEEEREHTPADQLVDITVELAPFVASARFNAAFLSLDGVRFFHGVTYSVSRKVADTMQDIMARGWEHEREIHGERRAADVNRHPILGHLGRDGVLNTRASMRRMNA